MIWCSLAIVVTFLSATIETFGFKIIDTISYTTISYTKQGTNCATDCINNVCYTDVYRQDTAPCSPGTESAPQYHTAQRKQTSPDCTTRCGTYGYSYEWCYTGDTIDDKSWDYCSARIADYDHLDAKYITKNEIFCDTACDYYGYKYTWCYKVGGSWGECDKSVLRPYLPSYTYRGVRCAGACHQHSQSYNWCYTGRWAWSWDYCAPPANRYNSNRSIKNLIDILYTTCKLSTKYSGRRLEKRATSACCYVWNLESVDCIWDQLVLSVQRNSALDPERYVIRTMTDEPQNAIRDYIMYDDDIVGTSIPLGVRANISASTITSAASRSSIPYHVSHINLPLLDARPDDDAGHIIASCNGGPATLYNLVPQDRLVNRRLPGASPLWRDIEAYVNNVARDPNNYVLENVVVVYEGMDDPQWPTGHSLRPIGFIVALSFHYDNDRNAPQNVLCYIPN